MKRLSVVLVFLLLLCMVVLPALPGVEEHMAPPLTASSAEDDEGGNSTLVYPFDDYFLDYPDYENITDTLHELEAEHPDIMKVYDLTALTSFGATHYNRVVWGVKISDGVSGEDDWYDDPAEEDIVIVGAHHAREWMTIMVSMYFIYYLVEFYDSPAIDNDGDGLVDEDPIDGFDNDGDGEDDDGDNATMARMDGRDNDEDGKIDEGIDEDGIEGLATYLVNHREIWVIPLLNPDGYEYDRTISEPGTGGGWRKNQRDQSMMGGKRSNGNGQFDEDTDGVDLNRNYPYAWNRNEKGYVVDTNGITVTSDSRIESDGQYRGPDDDIDDDDDGFLEVDPISGNRIYDPDRVDEDWWDGMDNDGDGLTDEDKDGGFTEPETQAMEELMKKLDIYDENDTTIYPEGYRPENHDRMSNVVAAISYHSYSALVIWPWGHTYEDPPHEPLLRHMGETIMHMTDYGSWNDQGGYKVSGEWGDWMYGSHGVLAYTLELNRGFQGGFHPPQEYIIPTVRMILGCNLYIGETANLAKVAKNTGSDDLDVDAPRIVYQQKKKSVEEDEGYEIKVKVENTSHLVPGSVKFYYRVGTGSWMVDSLQEKEEGVFSGKIPGQKEGKKVSFYFEARDWRGTFVYSGYAEGTPFSYEVKEKEWPLPAWEITVIVLILVIIVVAVLKRR